MSTMTEPLQGADKHWGFKFGCDGLLSKSKAAKFLGISIRTLDRKLEGGYLRKGRHPDTGSICICARSLSVYLERLEA